MMAQLLQFPPPQPPESSSTTAKLVLLAKKPTSEKVRDEPLCVMSSWMTVRLLAHKTTAVSSEREAAMYWSSGLQSRPVT